MTEHAKPSARSYRPPKVFRTALFGILLTIAAVIIGLGALIALSGNEAQAARGLTLLKYNQVLIVGLAVYLLFRLAGIFFQTSENRSAPHLHRRFILIFSLAALVPAILVGMFFKAIVDRNLSDIFSPTVQETMKKSKEVSNAYLGKEIEDITRDVGDMAFDMNEAVRELPNRITYTAFLINQARYREFPVVYVIDESGRILSQAEGPEAPLFALPGDEMMKRAQDGTLTISSRNEIDFLIALKKLENYENAYLYTGRYLRSGLLPNLDRIDDVEKALARYSVISKDMNDVFKLTYYEVAILIFLAAIWLAMLLANRIVSPLGEMVKAAEKVRSGDLRARVNVSHVWDEIGDLANAFNRMTRQLFTQHQDLRYEHEISEQRRQFSEAVLSGVSAGVIGLSPEGRITVINRSAEDLLGLSVGAVIDKPLASVLSEFMQVLMRAKETIGHRAADQIDIETSRGTRKLDVRISAYEGEDAGWVITFDDITRLVAAQRHSAWRDVARRIAHEIKNPLTPIQLSAERIEKKYKNEIKSDPETFSNCTSTIIKQVGNLGRMVDEFSTFARMPTPVLEDVRIDRLLEETLFAQSVAFPNITFSQAENAGAIRVSCDERLVSQAVSNLLKNAAESVNRRIEEDGQSQPDGAIITRLYVQDEMVCIDIIDNGQGWPLEDRERLMEPYITTRDEGSGLGLAIVKRIAEDHGGRLELVRQKPGEIGAHVRFCLPLSGGLYTEPVKPDTQRNENTNENTNENREIAE